MKIIDNLKKLVSKIRSILMHLFHKGPKAYIVTDLGDASPLIPNSGSKDVPLSEDKLLFADEHQSVERLRFGAKCYSRYSELLADLSNRYIDDNLPVGTIIYVSRRQYVDYHMKERPNSNPKSYHNGPIARELHNHQFFRRRGVEFKQRTVELTKENSGFAAGEVFYEITRVK